MQQPIPPTPPMGASRSAGACCLGCAGLGMLVMGVALLFLIGSDTGIPALIAGMVLAMMPLPLYVGLALWLDRYEPEPPSLLFGAFLWGAVVAVFFSYILNTLNAVGAAVITGDPAAAEIVGAIISAPLVEESFKGLALLILFFWKKDEFEGVVDGVVYACMVALGFAMTENFQYYGNALAQGGAFDLSVTFVLRGIMSPFSHPLFTSFFGIGLGLARQSDSPMAKFLAPPAGLAIAMALHATWNATATIHVGAWLLAYLLIMLPAGLAVLIIVGFSLRHEGGLLRTYLAPEVNEGRLSAADYQYLQSVMGRINKATSALFSGGPAAWLACERFNNLSAELAFLRHKVSRGLVPPERAAQMEPEIMHRMSAERARFR